MNVGCKHWLFNLTKLNRTCIYHLNKFQNDVYKKVANKRKNTKQKVNHVFRAGKIYQTSIF